MLRTLLLGAAVVLFVIAGLLSGGVFSGAEAATLVCFGLACFAAAQLP